MSLFDRLGIPRLFAPGAGDAEEATDDDVQDAVEHVHFDTSASLTDPTATATDAAGVTSVSSDFSIDWDNDLEGRADGVNAVSAGLASGENEFSIQVSIEVPTKTLECPECGNDNEVPVQQFCHVDFSGDMEALSGDYAIGFTCDRCGFPH